MNELYKISEALSIFLMKRIQGHSIYTLLQLTPYNSQQDKRRMITKAVAIMNKNHASKIKYSV